MQKLRKTRDSHAFRGKGRSWFPLLLLIVTVVGCSSAPVRNPLPQEYSADAGFPEIPKARIWGDEPPPWFDAVLELPDDEMRRNNPATYGKPHHYLAISGGGANGAFGAGLLNGWSEAGTRPEFTMVTGISTGSLIAPFAFLGPEYDPVLKAIYTTYSTEDLVRHRKWYDIPRSDSIADTAPLREKIAQHMTEEVMRKIAAAHKAGRRLFIGTVNLDAMRPVMWNIGEIAASGQPGALDLIRAVMLASASIPGAFPPVYIEVEGGGVVYDEMHVDGGTATQVFLYPLGIDWRKVLDKLAVPGSPNIYVIRNSRIDPQWSAVEPRIGPVISRSVSSLIRTQGIGDMYRMYLGARRDNLDYHLAFIPADFDAESNEVFDPVYMNALYERAYGMARDGYPWRKTPPGMQVKP
ncbi:MAG: patatin-like phospholipase family protein [Pseudomonadota bacterium]|nr:patatin-like phospholipase family protein [Pseudomonadota bacterium]